MTATTRVYVDMVGDLFHAGHVALLRVARELGDHLVVGVLSDETAMAYKRQPIMTLAERVAVIEACRYVDEVIADAPMPRTDSRTRVIECLWSTRQRALLDRRAWASRTCPGSRVKAPSRE